MLPLLELLGGKTYNSTGNYVHCVEVVKKTSFLDCVFVKMEYIFFFYRSRMHLIYAKVFLFT
jgi:hypothetical protein